MQITWEEVLSGHELIPSLSQRHKKLNCSATTQIFAVFPYKISDEYSWKFTPSNPLEVVTMVSRCRERGKLNHPATCFFEICTICTVCHNSPLLYTHKSHSLPQELHKLSLCNKGNVWRASTNLRTSQPSYTALAQGPIFQSNPI